VLSEVPLGTLLKLWLWHNQQRQSRCHGGPIRPQQSHEVPTH